jgi:hypothetical protein
VLRPGGRVALSVWAAPERNPWQSVGAGVLRDLGLAPPPAPGEPSPFGLADEGRLRGLLDGRGWSTRASRRSSSPSSTATRPTGSSS